MFYVSSKNGSHFGVTDTKDNVQEYYSREELLAFHDKGITIHGVTSSKITITSPEVIKLTRTSGGTPLRIKISSTVDYKQVIYMGFGDGKFNFFDGQGISGYFQLSTNWFIERKDKPMLDFENNDPVKVAKLLKELK